MCLRAQCSENAVVHFQSLEHPNGHESSVKRSDGPGCTWKAGAYLLKASSRLQDASAQRQTSCLRVRGSVQTYVEFLHRLEDLVA